MLAPIAADWTFTSPVSGQYSFNRIASIPAPATQWGFRIRVVGGAWTNIAPQIATPRTGSVTPGTTQQGQIAWYSAGGDQLSPWSDVKSVLIT